MIIQPQLKELLLQLLEHEYGGGALTVTQIPPLVATSNSSTSRA